MPSAKFVAYDFIELRAESDDGRTIGRGLGELDRQKLDLETKTKTVGGCDDSGEGALLGGEGVPMLLACKV